MSAGKLRSPLMQEPSLLVVNDHIVLNVIGEQNDMTLLVPHQSMAIVHWSFRPQHAPLRNSPVTELLLTKNLASLRTHLDRGRGTNHKSGFEKAAAADLAHDRCWVSWCAREDLNLHSLRNQILSLARLPIPPRTHSGKQRCQKYAEAQAPS